MPSDRFHKAAEDGMIEILKEATTRDCNAADQQGMTPTLYAAFHGNLEALRLLCGRGGDPDKADIFGNTALHLAAAEGHKDVVTFLVNFGANIYATDVDGRTAQELAGINYREDILRFLDEVHTKLEAEDKKKTKLMKERAKKDSEKRKNQFIKLQKKKEKTQEKLENQKIKPHRPSVIQTLKTKIKSSSNLKPLSPPAPRNSFSAIVGNGTLGKNVGSVQRKVLANRASRAGLDDFKISEVEDGKRSVRSLTGIRRDSEVLYTNTINTSRRERLENVFNEFEDVDSSQTPESMQPPPLITLQRSISQPDYLNELNSEGAIIHDEPASVFTRPGIGTLVFRKSISNAIYHEEDDVSETDNRSNRSRTDDEFYESDTSEDDNPLERFLTAWGLGEYFSEFEERKIDLQTLMLLKESDLESLGLPLGHLRNLEKAISERKAALANWA